MKVVQACGALWCIKSSCSTLVEDYGTAGGGAPVLSSEIPQSYCPCLLVVAGAASVPDLWPHWWC